MKTVDELEKQINLLKLIKSRYPNSEIKPIGSNSYRVNPCPHCGSRDHFTVYVDTNSYSSFSRCLQGGKAYKFLQEVEGLTDREAYQELLKITGDENLTMNTNKKKSAISEAETTLQAQEKQDFTKLVYDYYNSMNSDKMQKYQTRGIKPETVNKYKLGINGDYFTIPVFEGGKCHYYSQRHTDKNADKSKKHKNPPNASVEYFNKDYLKDPEITHIAVTEGAFDSLSLEQIGVKSIALNSVNQVNSFKTLVEATGYQGVLIGAMDNDKAGQGANKAFNDNIIIPQEYKDINEWATAEPTEFEESVLKQVQAIKNKEVLTDSPSTETPAQGKIEPLNGMQSLEEYLNNSFLTDIANYKACDSLSTGFELLDKEIGGLRQGLYVIGGTSGVGKTTFVHQIADSLAKSGKHVLFFSLEQSQFELVSKSLTRLAYEMNPDNPIDRNSIKRDEAPDSLNTALKEFKQFAGNITVIEGDYRTTVGKIKDTVNAYIETRGVKPIVIIDYLQIIRPAENTQYETRRSIDFIVSELRCISRDLNLVVMVISAFNRASYTNPISYESFKESGGIEYTADVVCGLEFAEIDNIVSRCRTNGRVNEEDIRKELKAEQEGDIKTGIRKIKLTGLKNRGDKALFSQTFDYNPKFDHFKETK